MPKTPCITSFSRYLTPRDVALERLRSDCIYKTVMIIRLAGKTVETKTAPDSRCAVHGVYRQRLAGKSRRKFCHLCSLPTFLLLLTRLARQTSAVLPLPVRRACQDCAANLQVGSGIFAGINQVLGVQAVYRYGRRRTTETPTPGVEHASGTARGCRGVLC